MDWAETSPRSDEERSGETAVNNSRNNIALIGFMGTGKTAVGKTLAEKLGRDFYELDAIIEEKAGKPIPAIFADEGEIAFREMEIAVVKETAAKSKAVIACGGGIILNKINIDRLRETGVTIQLTATPGAILARTSQAQGSRPLLDVDDPAARIVELMDYRKPYYERSSDIIIDTSSLDIPGVVDNIILNLKADESFDL